MAFYIRLLLTCVLLASTCIRMMQGKEHCRTDSTYGWVKDEMCKDGYAIRCENSGLKHIPKSLPRYPNSSKPCLLDLSQNYLKEIQNNAFVTVQEIKVLFIYKNNISWIDSHAFANLTKLKILNLSSNALHYPESFGKGVFNSLTNLTYINLKNNSIHSYEGLQDLLKPLYKLESLYLSGCVNCTFSKGFENFKRLKNVSLSGVACTCCKISTVPANMFTYLPHVRNVFMSNCQIKTVEKMAFARLKNIKRLDISYNDELGFRGMRDVLDGLVNSSIIQLNFNHIHEQYEMGLMLKYEHMKPIQYLKNLEVLLMDLNKIEIVEGNVFELIPNATKFIALSGNRLTKGKYVANLTKLEHVEELDLSYQHLDYDPFYQDHYEPEPKQGVHLQLDSASIRRARSTRFEKGLVSYSASALVSQDCLKCLADCKQKDITCVCVPPKLKYLKYRKSFVYFHVGRFGVCSPLSLERLDLSFNLIMNWTGPVFGLGKLKRLNLEENFCYAMSPSFFDNLFGLTYLNVSYNFLGQILKPNGVDDGRHFKNLTRLQDFDLSENRIKALPENVFLNLVSIKQLNLSRNMLGRWNSTLKANCLEILDLSGNKLDTLPESLRDYLDDIEKESTRALCYKTKKVKVILDGNPFHCNCDTRPFLRWLSTTSVDVKMSYNDECLMQDGSRLPLKEGVIPDLVARLDRECFPIVSIALSVSAFVVGAAMCIVVYRYRWKLRHWYYSKRKRHRHRGYDRLFERDAFISYASTDGRFIKRFLIPALEEERGLKVWVADRDSVPGLSIAENLAHAINFSKKTVLLLSRRYFKEGWCDYEMNLARIESIESQRKLFIMVLFDDITPNEIPLDCLRLLQSEESIEYPTNPQDHSTFWDSLCDSIKSE